MSADGTGKVKEAQGALLNESLDLLLIHFVTLSRLVVSRRPSDQEVRLPGFVSATSAQCLWFRFTWML